MATERKFVFAPDMKALGERVKAAEDAAEAARDLFDKIEDADDICERLVYLAAHVRDYARGVVDSRMLQSACTAALTDLEDQLSGTAREAVREAVDALTGG